MYADANKQQAELRYDASSARGRNKEATPEHADNNDSPICSHSHLNPGFRVPHASYLNSLTASNQHAFCNAKPNAHPDNGTCRNSHTHLHRDACRQNPYRDTETCTHSHSFA